MDVDFDFSDVDSFFDEGEWEVEKKMIDVGDESVKYAEEHGDYQDHTLTLRTSNKYDIDKYGLNSITMLNRPKAINMRLTWNLKGLMF